jgi:hypothetical protein
VIAAGVVRRCDVGLDQPWALVFGDEAVGRGRHAGEGSDLAEATAQMAAQQFQRVEVGLLRVARTLKIAELGMRLHIVGSFEQFGVGEKLPDAEKHRVDHEIKRPVLRSGQFDLLVDERSLTLANVTVEPQAATVRTREFDEIIQVVDEKAPSDKDPVKLDRDPMPPQEEDTDVGTIWYCTNRRPLEPNRGEKGFSKERGEVTYGACRVRIPPSHKLGSVGSSWWTRILSLQDDRIKLVNTRIQNDDDFWTSIDGRERFGRNPHVGQPFELRDYGL